MVLQNKFKLVYIESLAQAQKELQGIQEKVVLINPAGSSWYLGVKVIHHMLDLIKDEFKIEHAIIDADDDIAAVFSALKLGYSAINPVDFKILPAENQFQERANAKIHITKELPKMGLIYKGNSEATRKILGYSL